MGRMRRADVEAIYRKEHPRLWRSLASYCGDPDVASDAEAEAFTQLIARGEAVRNPAAWVWRSSFRIAAGLLAARSRNAPNVQLRTEAGPEDAALVEMLELLDQLTDQQRACVVLRYIAGLTGPEIAENLGTTPGTVRVQLHRAHQTLRQSLEAS